MCGPHSHVALAQNFGGVRMTACALHPPTPLKSQFMLENFGTFLELFKKKFERNLKHFFQEFFFKLRVNGSVGNCAAADFLKF